MPTGETIQITADSLAFSCYISGQGKSNPAVIVLHAWWGLNDFIRGFCDKFAAEGYYAIAPDLYGGRIASTVEQAEDFVSKLDSEEAVRKVIATLNSLLADRQLSSRKVGVVGFSLGAFFALDLGSARGEVKAVVIFYGTSSTREWNNSQAAYLGHFAEKDPYESATFVLGLEKSLKSAGKSVNFYTYPNTGHWFFESDRQDAYNQKASTLAWERTIEFLHTTLDDAQNSRPV